MENQLVRIFPIEQLQMSKRLIALKKLDHGEFQLPSVLLVREPKIIKNLVMLKYR